MHRFRYDGTGPARSFTARLPSSRIVSIGKSGGEGADGLGRPTFVEHAIAAVPLPYLGTSTIVALLAKGPGYLLARLIENGGDRNQTVAEIFGDALALPLGDRSAHGGGEASRHGYREFTGRGCLRARHRRKPDLRTQSARSARPAPPHARDPSAPGGGTPNPDPADVAVRDAGDDPHCRDHLDRRRRRLGVRHRRLFPVTIASTGDDPKFKAPRLVCGPGIADALRCMWHDEQGDLPLLPLLWGLLDHRRHGGGARDSGDSRIAHAAVAPSRSPSAGVRPTAAHARLRRPVRGRLLLPRPGRRLLPERQPAHGAPALVGSDPGRPGRLPSSRGLDRECRALLGPPRRLELRDRLPSMVLHAVTDPDAWRTPRRHRDGQLLVLPVPILSSRDERFARRLARGRGDRGPAVRLHWTGPVLDDPAVATYGRGHLSRAEAVSRVRAGRGCRTPGPRAG